MIPSLHGSQSCLRAYSNGHNLVVFSFLFKVQYIFPKPIIYADTGRLLYVAGMLSYSQHICQRLLLVVWMLLGFHCTFYFNEKLFWFPKVSFKKRCPVQIVWFPSKCLFGSRFLLILWDNGLKVVLHRLYVLMRVESWYKISLLILSFLLNSPDFFLPMNGSLLPSISCLVSVLDGLDQVTALTCLTARAWVSERMSWPPPQVGMWGGSHKPVKSGSQPLLIHSLVLSL